MFSSRVCEDHCHSEVFLIDLPGLRFVWIVQLLPRQIQSRHKNINAKVTPKIKSLNY